MNTRRESSVVMFKELIIIVVFLVASAQVSTKWTWKTPLCYIQECCHPNDGTGYLNYDKGAGLLLGALSTKVFGQPLIVAPIYRSLLAHLRDENPPRPLIMYFSGWTGTGKTYTARLIAQHLYKKGMESNYVKYISSSYHFPLKIEGEDEILKQRLRLREMIRETVSQCHRSLIILDELDKLPAGVVDSLQPLLDYVDDVDGVKYNKAIFIFLSNTGSDKLNTLAYKMYTEGKERKDLSMKDMEEILVMESYNERGGLRQSELLKRYSIGVFVPFLPLERQHIRQCIRVEIEQIYVTVDDLPKVIEEIADELSYSPNDTNLYSKSGCKGIHEKVVNYIGLPYSAGNSGSPTAKLRSEL